MSGEESWMWKDEEATSNDVTWSDTFWFQETGVPEYLVIEFVPFWDISCWIIIS